MTSMVAKGIRIVEVSDYVFVPLAGAVLAGWGADVIKVEHHQRGDAIRDMRINRTAPTSGPSRPPSGVAIVPANRGKRSIGLNLTTPEGREVLYELVRDADVFITNRTNSALVKLGVDRETIRTLNPNIIYARGTAHGSRGPLGDVGGFDTADFWYRGGIASALHIPGDEFPPGLPAPGFGDNTSGHHLAAGILGALLHRERTGEALTVEVSLLGSALWAMSGAVAISSVSGEPPKNNPRGRVPNALNNIYATRDEKFVNVATMQGFRYLAEFAAAIGVPGIETDERFDSEDKFYENKQELTDIFGEVIAEMTQAEFVERMRAYSGQWAPVENALTVPDDPQVIANGYIGRMRPDNDVKDVVPPVQYNDTPTELLPAPDFNQHGEEILRELGRTDEQIVALRAAGAITA